VIAGTLISISEGLEAFLIVVILVGCLTKVKRPQLKVNVWIGTVVALAVSALQEIPLLEGASTEFFEAVVALLAVGLLTWIGFLMQRQSRGIKGELVQKAYAAISGNPAFAQDSSLTQTVKSVRISNPAPHKE
jgi:high-affinity iron transporter